MNHIADMKGNKSLSKINLNITYGFIAMAIITLFIVAISYIGLQRLESSFTYLHKSVTDRILALEDLRGTYSSMLLEMTTFLVIDFKGEEKSAQLALLDSLQEQFSNSGKKFDRYLTSAQDVESLRALDTASEESVVLLKKIVKQRDEGIPISEILPFKKELKKIEAEQFFPLIEKMLEDGRSLIEAERLKVDSVSSGVKASLLVFSFLAIILYLIIGYIVIKREESSDEFRDQLISIASHQLKMPITTIKWNLEILDEKRNLLGKDSFLLDDLGEGVSGLSAVVNNLLDLSRIDQGRFILDPKQVPLDTMIKSIVSSLDTATKSDDIKVQFDELRSPVFVFVDDFRVSQAIKNVIDNAIKYSARGGVVNVGFDELSDKIIISVKDAGIGIPEDEQGKIFGRFFRASNTAGKVSGSGLGLFIVKRVIEDSGGEISFKSVMGEGTTFFIAIPKSKNV